jgi:hypothetical protein
MKKLILIILLFNVLNSYSQSFEELVKQYTKPCELKKAVLPEPEYNWYSSQYEIDQYHKKDNDDINVIINNISIDNKSQQHYRNIKVNSYSGGTYRVDEYDIYEYGNNITIEKKFNPVDILSW